MEKTCIIALSFGGGSIRHGLSNENIGEEVLRVSKKYNIPAIVQWEIYENIAKDFKGEIHSISSVDGRYLDTYKMLHQAKKIMIDKKYQSAHLIAHQDHVLRVRLVAKKLNIKEIILEPQRRFPYYKKSCQWWTRSRFLFWLREIPAYIYYFLKGWV